MKGPTFIVIGAAKCGTTTVCDLLGTHPEIFMSSPKEPHYFSRLTRYDELRSWYLSLFEGADSNQAVGEGSTSYSHPHRIDFVVPRIRETLPDCRLIYMVRHPIRRLESDWKMRLREGRPISDSIVDATDEHASLITFGLYWKHLQAYRAVFPDDQILIVFLEDFSSSPTRELSRIFEHVGVDPSFIPDNPGRRRNAADHYRKHGVLASALCGLPGFRRMRNAAPGWAVTLVKRLATKQADPRPDWDPAVLELVKGYFREDSRKLLEYCGKPEDYWTL